MRSCEECQRQWEVRQSLPALYAAIDDLNRQIVEGERSRPRIDDRQSAVEEEQSRQPADDRQASGA